MWLKVSFQVLAHLEKEEQIINNLKD